MHRITLVTIGKLKESWAHAACAQYVQRLRGIVDMRIMELPPSRQPHAGGQVSEESERLRAVIEKLEGEVWILDERGDVPSSAEIATALSSLRDSGRPLVLILGGAYGLTDALRSRADRLLAFGRITLPHDLCRVVALEQLYRAVQIARGSGYHHGDATERA